MREIGSFKYRRSWWTVWLASQKELAVELDERRKRRYIYHGCCDFQARRILLYERLGPWQRRLSFYHELVEMLNGTCGLDLKHSAIEALGDELGRLLTFGMGRKRK